MTVLSSGSWRLWFIVSAILLLAGGPQHPGGTMAEMLAHPDWVWSHALVLVGFVTVVIGLILFARGPLPPRTRRWTRIATVGTALQAVEMAFHTAASVDHANLMAGNPTPVLSTHLFLSTVLYPVFAITFIGLIVAGVRDRTLGSRWIAWLGIAGVAAHGAAALLVVALGIEPARVLFPLLTLWAIWLLLAALWLLPAEASGTDAYQAEQGVVS